ncbi:hypothetical protein [Acetivibrio cellulolyticus]|uniref:hypothetical protein n=1 Tax=Acetivibrio cellulolyticus TaxID=35830 RepID=UPI0001E2C6DB|nr:hypothetical protein [Acetivibrio cellulolyticus]
MRKTILFILLIGVISSSIFTAFYLHNKPKPRTTENSLVNIFNNNRSSFELIANETSDMEGRFNLYYLDSKIDIVKYNDKASTPILSDDFKNYLKSFFEKQKFKYIKINDINEGSVSFVYDYTDSCEVSIVYLRNVSIVNKSSELIKIIDYWYIYLHQFE